ncbi:hypothetical protein BCR36DRAFT_328277, partial [Piromyces finnis]
MSRKSFSEIQSYINESIVSLIERNSSFATWLDSDQYQINITISYKHLPHYKQIGPTCGLTALLMIKDYYNKYENYHKTLNNSENQKEFSERLNELLNIAIKKQFTNKGEMFWSKGMALLLKNYCGLKCKVLKFHDEHKNSKKSTKNTTFPVFSKNANNQANAIKNYSGKDQYNFSLLNNNPNNETSINKFQKINQTIIRNLLKDNLCLIPYDKDGNNEPCFKQGHKAHWCIINGFIIVEPLKLEQSCESNKVSKFNIVWKDTKEVSNNSNLKLENRLNNLYYICTHSGSSYPGLFKADQLLQSNSQLTEVAPAVIKETKETIYHDIYNSIKNVHMTNSTTIFNNDIRNSKALSLLLPPPPPPPQALNNDNNNITNLKSHITFSQFNSSKLNNNSSLNSCQKTQIDRKGYIIPNFYSFPKKNIYHWEQYQVNLRKDLFSNKKNKNLKTNPVINYQGHSLKETLCSSLILVGKKDY